MPTAPLPEPIEPRQLREDELLRLFCHHRDRGDHARAAEMWQHLAVRSHDRVVGLARTFRFPGGGALSPEDAADAAQNAYLRVVAMGGSFEGSAVGQFRAALHQCVHHTCMDLGRRELRHEVRRAGSLDERYDDDGEAGPYDEAIARHSREQEAFAAEDEHEEERRREAAETVAWAIAQVANDNYRAVLELTYRHQLAAEQIAERLGITIDNVYARRSRGVKQLEAILRDHRA